VDLSADVTAGPARSRECGGQWAEQQVEMKFDLDLLETLRGPMAPDQKLDIWLRATTANDAECVAGYRRRLGDQKAWSAIRSVFGAATRDQIHDLARFVVITRVALNKPSLPTPPPALAP
jgi:hypothetical protein